MEKGQMTTLGKLARILGAELRGPEDHPVERPVSAGCSDPGGITFAGDAKHIQLALESSVGAIILPPSQADPDRPHLVHPNPRLAFAMVLAFFERPLAAEQGIHPSASVHPTAQVNETAAIAAFAVVGPEAKIGPKAVIHSFAYVGDRSSVGEGSVIYPHATLYHDVTVGKQCLIHSGTVIGADGFGYAWDGTCQRKIPQVGRVIVGDFVEVGANACIDRATFEETVIESGVKIDDLVMIGHNCRIGAHSVLAGQSGMGGSSTVGSGSVLAGQAGLGDHTHLEPGTTITGQTGVQGHVPKGVYAGSPGMPFKQALKGLAVSRRLPELEKRVIELESKLAALLEEKSS